MNQLDRTRPFGETRGDPRVCYKQDGFDFDSQGKLIPGSKNSASAKIAEKIENKATSMEREPFEEMSIHELKKASVLVYAEFEAADIEFEPVELGPGAKKRLIDFLNDHA